MPRILPFALLVASLSHLTVAQTTEAPRAAVNPSQVARSEQEVLQALASLRLAILKQDGAAIDRLFADTYLAVRVDGTFNDKAGLMRNNQSAAVKYDVYEDTGPARVQIYVDTAVAVSDIRVQGRGPKGLFKEVRRATSVWLKRDGRWRIIAAHMSRVP